MNKIVLISCLIAIVMLAGYSEGTIEGNSIPTPDDLTILVKHVNGYGNCTFAYIYADGYHAGGPQLVLIGCK